MANVLFFWSLSATLISALYENSKHMTPTEFEQEIAKLEEALKGRNATVTWDSKIPDPDNPRQLRQVDILIEDGGAKTIVECRHHKARQDVKWIEEIFGRKESLNATSAIAVSSSGFTDGAVKKAKRFGVVLRTFEDISLRELTSWGARFEFRIHYIKFLKFELYPVLPTIVTTSGGIADSNIVNSTGELFDVSRLYYSIASAIGDTEVKGDGFAAYLDCSGLYSCGEKIEELIVNGQYIRITKNKWLPSVHQYRSPSHGDQLTMIKNGSPFNRSAMYQTEESVFQVIDISMTDLIDGAILRSVECIFDRQVPMSGMALTGIDNSGMRIMPLKVVPIRKNSNLHLEIQRKCAANMQEIPKT